MHQDKIIQGLTDKLLQLICVTSRKKTTLQEIVTECKMTKHSKVQAMEMYNQVSKLNVDVMKWKDGRARYHKIEMLCKYCGRSHKP